MSSKDKHTHLFKNSRINQGVGGNGRKDTATLKI